MEKEFWDDEETDQEEAESPERRPASRLWLPKASQRKKKKVEINLAEVTTERGGHARPSKVSNDSDEPIFISKEISDEIRNWHMHGLSAKESKGISKKFALDFEVIFNHATKDR